MSSSRALPATGLVVVLENFWPCRSFPPARRARAVSNDNYWQRSELTISWPSTINLHIVSRCSILDDMSDTRARAETREIRHARLVRNSFSPKSDASLSDFRCPIASARRRPRSGTMIILAASRSTRRRREARPVGPSVQLRQQRISGVKPNTSIPSPSPSNIKLNLASSYLVPHDNPQHQSRPITPASPSDRW